jgi:Ca2+-binding RTX toxin-like protein
MSLSALRPSRRILLAAVLALLAMLIVAGAPASRAAADDGPLTCKDERTGRLKTVTRALTEGNDSSGVLTNEVLATLGGNDLVSTSSARNAVICLGAGDDQAFAFFSSNPNGPFSIRGGGGNDSIVGSNYDDALNGMTEDDFLSGLGGYDVLNGGPGYDTCVGGEVNIDCEVIR